MELLHTVNLLLSPLGGGGLFISNTFEGGGGWGLIGDGGVFNLAKKMVSVLHKDRESGKAQVKEVGGHTAEVQ